MSAATPHRYERKGVLAVHPSAFFDFFFFGPDAVENKPSEDGKATLVTIRGPLAQHDEGWEDSYESILARVHAACAEQSEAIVLLIDSPGGDAAGCFDCAREIRAACDAAGKYLIAYVQGKACSAAYAIASGCKRIVMDSAAIVGSIGVLATRPDFSVQNAQMGFRVSFITSGTRKADGHPDSPTTDAELVETQKLVDSMAGVFFELVAEHRDLTVEAIAALQAGVFHGDAAREAGLGDETLTLRATLASVASWIQTERNSDMAGKVKAEGGDDKDKDKDKDAPAASPFDSAREALRNAAKGDDANAERAKKALAALEGEDDEKAEGGDEPAGEPKKDDAAAAAASALAAAVRAEKAVHNLKAEIAKRDEADERRTLLARSDLSKEMRALLEKAPIALVRETIKDLGDPPAPAAGATAAQSLAAQQAGAKPTAGEGSNAPSALPPAEKAALDRRMGINHEGTPKAGNVHTTPIRLTLGGSVGDPKTPPQAS